MFRDRAVAVVDAHPSDAPLFLYYASHAAHCQLQVPPALVEEYSAITNGTDEGACVAQSGPDFAPMASGVYPGFDGPYQCRGLYAASVAVADRNLGAITDALKRNDLWKDTLLVFQSDNGGCEQLVLPPRGRVSDESRRRRDADNSGGTSRGDAAAAA